MPQKLMAKLLCLVVVGHLASGESVDLLAQTITKDKHGKVWHFRQALPDFQSAGLLSGFLKSKSYLPPSLQEADTLNGPKLSET